MRPAQPQRALLVLGMHRGGTSALSRVASLLGAAGPAHPVPPGPDNPRGFWEPQPVVRLNDEALLLGGSHWVIAGWAIAAEAGFVPGRGAVTTLAWALHGYGVTPAETTQLPVIPVPFAGSVAAGAPRRRLRMPAAWPGLVSIGAMILAWSGLSASGAVPRDLLPTPWDVWAAAREIMRDGYRGTTLQGNALSTLGRMAGGFGLATVLGVPLGLWMGRVRMAQAVLGWLVQFMRPLPPLSYMILLILWLGTGDGSKTALLFLTAFPIIVAASAAGAGTVALQRIQAAQALGASRGQVLRHVVLPSAAPMVLTGLQIALAAAFSTVVSAELMAATDGLGWMVISASTFLRNDIIILCILLLGAMGVTLAWALRRLDRRFIHWRGRL